MIAGNEQDRPKAVVRPKTSASTMAFIEAEAHVDGLPRCGLKRLDAAAN
jgi:hypothetical protein